MKNFIKNALSDKEGTVSSKRIMSFLAILLLTTYTIVGIWLDINMEIYYTLAVLTGYNGLLTVLPKKKIKEK